MSYDELSSRKQKILQVLIDKYITTAEPVSSKDIQEQDMQEYSSATIRSELATLEEMGYLFKPHVSAGRMPSPKAYKLYVEKLMQSKPLMAEELNRLREHCEKKFLEVEEIVKSTVKIISDVTNYTSLIVLKDTDNLTISSIKLIDINDNAALVVIITESGVISDKTISIPADVGKDYFQVANELVNNLFSGRTLGEIKQINVSLTKEMEEFKQLFEDIIEILTDYSENPKVFLEGAKKMLEYPEYNDINHAKQFLSLIESKERLSNLMEKENGIEFGLKIGRDDSGLDNCAIVTAKYRLGGKDLGYAGVIGPERMDYNKVLSVLNYISKTLNEINDKDEE
ncbi:MAG: heat-inducible transcriptional repressor HrcA [Christensenellales bacterium]|jgi:heat-inducible transcriptional repressor